MKSVVATMKTLAAARIRQFETAADATESYSVTVELALQILMQNRTAAHQLNQLTRDNELTGLVLLGSDQGFCGRFNEAVLQTIAEGFGCAFVSELSVNCNLGAEELCKVKVDGLTVDRQIWLANLKSRALSPAAKAFKEVLTKFYY